MKRNSFLRLGNMIRLILSSIKREIKALRGLTAEGLNNLLSKRVLGRDLSELLVYLLIVVYTIVFSYFATLKHYTFRSYAWDLGIYNQAFWTTLRQGRLFYYTSELYFNPSGNYFGVHFSPILFLVLPVYSIHQAAETLLIFQSFTIALSALPLYWLARDKLNNRLVALGFSATYLLYPILHGVNWFDFHVQAFLPLFFFLAMYYLENEKWTKYFAFIILALAVAESVCVVVLFIGLFILWRYRKPFFSTLKQRAIDDKRILIPLVTMSLAISWFLVARWIQGAFFPIDPKFSSLYRAVDNWSVFGIDNDPIMMPVYMILKPLNALEALAYEAYLKFAFVVLLFGSLLLLPLRSSISFITLAWLGPALLSNYQAYYLLGNHYPAYVIPFIFVAAVSATKKKIPTLDVTKVFAVVRNLLILGIIFSVFASPLSPLLTQTELYVPHFSEYYLPTITEHVATLHAIVDLIPPNASVLTQNNLFPHFSGRLNAYVCPLPRSVSYAPEDMKTYVDQLINKSEYVLVDMKTDTYGASGLIFGSRMWRQSFGLFATEDDVYLYKRDYEGFPTL